MRQHVHKQNGFTLIELLIVVAILGIVMGAVYSVFIANQRTAYTTDEVVEVQQNLRIAMEAVTKDLYSAGFLIDTANTPAISAFANNGGLKSAQVLNQAPVPAGSDTVTINMATLNNAFTRSSTDVSTGSSTITVMPPVAATQVAAIRLFNNNNSIKIIRFESGKYRDLGLYTIDPVGGVDILNNTINFTPAVTEDVKIGDRIVLVPAGTSTPPTVRYELVNAATTTAGPNTCPNNQLCLQRTIPTGSEIVAQNMSDFQLRYILDDNSVTDTPADTKFIKAVIVTVWGETQATRLLSGDVPKIRQLSSVIRLRNRINKADASSF
jgi:prepilin-type N-terminal cleavage/methylation domain-containing protein